MPNDHKGRPIGNPNTSHGGHKPRRMTQATARYLGNAGNSHLFSAEATGGGQTDSYEISLNPEDRVSMQRGSVYHIGMDRGPSGYHPTPIAAHPDQKPGVAQWED
jgi:hypothetical protein